MEHTKDAEGDDGSLMIPDEVIMGLARLVCLKAVKHTGFIGSGMSIGSGLVRFLTLDFTNCRSSVVDSLV